MVGSDPMVLSEIQQMTDDARSHLQKLLDRLILPGSEGPRWFYKGSELSVKNTYDLRNELSQIMQCIFCDTPKINNEMIVRHKPTPTLVNSRKKLLIGILERSGQEMLGIEGNYPDASMFRTILWRTGLYTNKDEVWKYALPNQVEDPGLQKVWGKIQQFFTGPSEKPKDLQGFFDELMEPPFGVRAGLLPILFTAGLKAFPSVYSLRYKGRGYVSDILPSEIEKLCREPKEYDFIVLDIDQTKRDYLNAVLELFDTQARLATWEMISFEPAMDALENWKMGLPAGVLSTRYLTQRTRRFQAILHHQSDPVQLLFERIPKALNSSIDEQHDVIGITRKMQE